MKRTFKIVETYWKEIEVNARSEDKALMLAKEQARKTSLGKNMSLAMKLIFQGMFSQKANQQIGKD